jgi:hypothetical protein
VKIASGTPKMVPQTVTVADQFRPTAGTFTLKKPRLLCNPVDKNGEGIKNADAHLVCYQAKRASGVPKHARLSGVQTNNQFGVEVQGTIKERTLCIPSTKVVIP